MTRPDRRHSASIDIPRIGTRSAGCQSLAGPIRRCTRSAARREQCASGRGERNCQVATPWHDDQHGGDGRGGAQSRRRCARVRSGPRSARLAGRVGADTGAHGYRGGHTDGRTGGGHGQDTRGIRVAIAHELAGDRGPAGCAGPAARGRSRGARDCRRTNRPARLRSW